MWRVIARWIGPNPPCRAEESDGVLLGIVALAVVTISLPYLFGVVFGS